VSAISFFQRRRYHLCAIVGRFLSISEPLNNQAQLMHFSGKMCYRTVYCRKVRIVSCKPCANLTGNVPAVKLALLGHATC
jgi:hypothetical protein